MSVSAPEPGPLSIYIGNIPETGDLETTLTAANTIGDNKLHKEVQSYLVPDTFTLVQVQKGVPDREAVHHFE